jgi:hypothetical protein
MQEYDVTTPTASTPIPSPSLPAYVVDLPMSAVHVIVDGSN